MTLEDLSAVLHRRYGPDAGQEALVALVARPTPPDDVVAFCHTVAQRYVRRHGREGLQRTPRDAWRMVRLAPSEYRAYPTAATQLVRLEARETLRTLSPVMIAKGLGLLDPDPQPGAEAPWQEDPRHRWTRLRRRAAKRGARGK